ncbi:MAG TPA: hypothetical protein VJN94_17775 [Candidatus Binataceae bacterium]|nr:hypothetical protein [Candidatus Binataceae bacterium]
MVTPLIVIAAHIAALRAKIAPATTIGATAENPVAPAEHLPVHLE